MLACEAYALKASKIILPKSIPHKEPHNQLFGHSSFLNYFQEISILLLQYLSASDILAVKGQNT